MIVPDKWKNPFIWESPSTNLSMVLEGKGEGCTYGLGAQFRLFFFEKFRNLLNCRKLDICLKVQIPEQLEQLPV